MLLRAYLPADAEPTLEVFRRAIRLTAIDDYTIEQVAAWSGDDIDLAEWAAKRASADTIVADEDGVVGFTDVDAGGYIDMMFVDPDFGRRGVATELLGAATAHAIELGATELTTRASITARPFFEHNGFDVVAEQHPTVRGVSLTNFAMRRALGRRTGIPPSSG